MRLIVSFYHLCACRREYYLFVFHFSCMSYRTTSWPVPHPGAGPRRLLDCRWLHCDVHVYY